MQEILGLVRRCVEDYDMIQAGDTVAVGVSGGKDSLLTLTALARLSRFYPKPFRVVAITIEAGTPGMSFDGVADYCRALGVEYIRVNVPIYEVVFLERREKNPCSLCAKLRRGALSTAMNEHGIKKIALGHHYDDAVETMLMSLIFEDPPASLCQGAAGRERRKAAGAAHCGESLPRQRRNAPAGDQGAHRLARGPLSRPQAEDLRRDAALPALRLGRRRRGQMKKPPVGGLSENM